MHDQRVLVTGGAGFIGSNLANRLAADNDVIAVDDTYLRTPENLDDNVEFVEADVIDDDFPADVDVLFHLAALSSRNMHENDPQRGCRVNVEGFVNAAVERARQEGCETVVYASTSSIYTGTAPSPPPVDMDVEARTAYEASKLARERYAEYYGNYHDMAMAGLRFFSVYQGFGGATRNTKASTRTRLRSSRTRSRTARPRAVRRRQPDARLHACLGRGACLRTRRRPRANGRVQRRYRGSLLVQRDGSHDQRRARHRHRSGVHRVPLRRLRPRHHGGLLDVPRGDRLGTRDRFRGGRRTRV